MEDQLLGCHRVAPRKGSLQGYGGPGLGPLTDVMARRRTQQEEKGTVTGAFADVQLVGGAGFEPATPAV
jgi:hypothetical protein